MKICVLQLDYTGSSVEYGRYDPPRDLSRLVPEWQVDNLFLHKLHVYKQLREAAGKGYDIFVNLCEGYPEWDVPSLEVNLWLERLGLPFTGPPLHLFNPPKAMMKYVAHQAGVCCPACVEAVSDDGIAEAARRLAYPMFVKPSWSGDSLGVDEASYVTDEASLRKKTRAIIDGFGCAIIEEYIAGLECSVLVASEPHKPFDPLVLSPLEYLFEGGARFKTYKLKVEEHHPNANVPVKDEVLARRLREASRAIWVRYEGQGYARLDYRVRDDGEIFFLDINFLCSIFYPEGYEGSADYILRMEPMGASGFLKHIVREGLERHRRRQRPYRWNGADRKNAGTCATRSIPKGGVVIRGEEQGHRLVTRSFIESHWPPDLAAAFRKTALPLGGGIYAVLNEDPAQWTPHRHSCEPNTAYRGLDLIALKDIAAGEDLTLDYGECYDDLMPAFDCTCGSANCRKRISGRAGNSMAPLHNRK